MHKLKAEHADIEQKKKEEEKPVSEEVPEVTEEFQEENPAEEEKPKHEEHHLPSLIEKLKKLHHSQKLAWNKDIEKKVKKLVKPKIVATEMPEDHENDKKERIPLVHGEENSSKRKFAKGTLHPTDLPPKTTENEGLPEKEHSPHPLRQEPHGQSFFKHPRSPAAFAAVIGLSCGALVIMLGIIVALVMRRNRANVTRILVPDAEPEDQEHLVKMQKSGYENPTYKFFYY